MVHFPPKYLAICSNIIISHSFSNHSNATIIYIKSQYEYWHICQLLYSFSYILIIAALGVRTKLLFFSYFTIFLIIHMLSTYVCQNQLLKKCH